MSDVNEEREEERFVDKRAASRAAAGAEGRREQGEVPAPDAVTSDGPEKEHGAEPVDELASEREKAETYYKNWQRAAADFQNFKRRVEQERSESARLSSAALVISLLPVYDDLDRAVASVDSTLAGLNWVRGVSAIHQKFGRLLEAMGVREVDAVGEQFDPARHEAIGRQPGEEGKVLHVAQKGYSLHDKVIRPAMVIVGSGE